MNPRPIAEHGRLRRFATRAVLLSGAALLGTYIAARVPREQTLVFKPGPVRVTSLSASWSAEGDAEPLGGVTLNFPEPTSRSIRHQTSLPNGDYVVRVELAYEPEPTPDGAPAPRAETTVVERVRLEGGETPIALGQKGM